VRCRIDSASPWPRVMSPFSNQLKQLLALFADGCCGSSRAKRKRSANNCQPLSLS
jgi:hypothetical protein